MTMLEQIRKRGRPKKTEAENENPQQNTGYSDNGEHTDEETAPKQRRTRGPNKSGLTTQLDLIGGNLTLTLHMVAGIISTRNKIDGEIILQGTPRLVESVVKLAEQDKRVRAYLLSMSTQSAYLNVITSSAAIIIPILANHNLLGPLFNPFGKANTNGVDNAVEQIQA